MEEIENTNEQTNTSGLVKFAQKLVESSIFDYFIIALILMSGAFLGLQTVPEISEPYGHLLILGNQIILGIFILEAVLKMLALAPRPHQYFPRRLERVRLHDHRLIARAGDGCICNDRTPRQIAPSVAADLHH